MLVHTDTGSSINLDLYVVLCMFICVEAICARDNDACHSYKFERSVYCSSKYGKTNMDYHIVFLLKTLFSIHLSSMCLYSVFLVVKGEFSDHVGTHFPHTDSRKKSLSENKQEYYVLLQACLCHSTKTEFISIKETVKSCLCGQKTRFNYIRNTYLKLLTVHQRKPNSLWWRFSGLPVSSRLESGCCRVCVSTQKHLVMFHIQFLYLMMH